MGMRIYENVLHISFFQTKAYPNLLWAGSILLWGTMRRFTKVSKRFKI